MINPFAHIGHDYFHQHRRAMLIVDVATKRIIAANAAALALSKLSAEKLLDSTESQLFQRSELFDGHAKAPYLLSGDEAKVLYLERHSFEVDGHAFDLLELEEDEALKRAQASHHQQRDLLALLRAQWGVGLLQLDEQGHIIFGYLPSFRLSDQLNQDPPNGKHFTEALPRTIGQALKRELGRFKLETQRERSFECSLDLSGSELSQYELTLLRGQSTPPQFTLLINNITKLKTMELNRDQLETRLRQAQKMETYGLLAGGIAHDFNNLLTIINMQLSLLRLDPHVESLSRPGLDEIQQAIDRGSNLTHQLLAMGRTQAMQPQSLSISDLIMRVMKLLRRVLGEYIHLESHAQINVPKIRADEDMLHQVLVNLAINARDAMPQGGTLSLRVSVASEEELKQRPAHAKAERYVKLEVEDCGEGIAPEHLPRVLEPFFTTKDEGRGTGLGLPTVYGIVIQHEGWLHIQSEVGVGTKVSLYFPVQEEDNVRPAPRSNNMPKGHERILVVEDDPALSVVASRVLTRCGYEVETAQDGEQALARFQEQRQPFDLLLTDLILPGSLSGAALAHVLRKQHHGLQVLITSGHSEEIIQKHWSGEHHFIRKPYMAHALAQAVRSCLDQG